MLALPSAVTAHAADPTQAVPWLVEIRTPTPFYWTTWDVPLSALSSVWTPRPVRVDGIDDSGGDIESVTIVAGDTDRLLAGIDLSTAQGLAGTRVILRQAWLDVTALPAVLDTVVRFDGQIEEPSYDEANATFRLRGPVLLQGKLFPPLKYGSTCPNTFNSPALRSSNPVAGWRCGYTGSDVACLRTWTACDAKGNSTRFGGMRNIPGPGTKITWAGGAFRLGGG